MSKNKQQTAVEWLLEEITYDNGTGQRLGSFKETVDLTEYFEKAKAIENERLKEMYLKGIENYDPTFKRNDN